MRNILENLDKAFENRVRLGIMAALVVNDWVDFNRLKELLKASDGNLASHLKALEKSAYIKFEKGFVGRKPNTKYAATALGKEAFERHLNALEELLNMKR